MKNRHAYLLVFIVLLALVYSQCLTHDNVASQNTFQWDMSVENHTGMSRNQFALDGKHRGMSVFNWRDSLHQSVNQLVKNNIECVALVPFLFQKTELTKVIRPRKSYDSWSYYDSAYMKVIDEVHSRDMHVMFKPHLWMHEGWRSNIQLDNEAEWDAWFDSYRKHMVHYAKFAALKDVELYCIGTELRTSIQNQPEKWDALIDEIRLHYKGKLTYAANWDGEYDDVKFWDRMDYIGLQAYFPISNSVKPSMGELKKGWEKHVKMLKSLSLKHNKQILFTETGYRSDETAAIKPWEWGSAQDTTKYKPSNMTQLNAYEALFSQLWNKEWFAGTYFWQWHNVHSPAYKVNNMDFTPRYKPAENALAKWYGK